MFQRGEEMSSTTHLPRVRVAVIGAGLSGIATGVALKQQGIENFVIFDRGPGVGGVWRDNTYPGVACDIPSQLYSYASAPNSQWEHTFARGSQIRDYIAAVAAEHGLGAQLSFGEELIDATWDAEQACWSIHTTSFDLTADVLVDATGPLTEPQIPDIPGLDTFEGTVFHSARWNHHHDLTGERVAVIGTGASSIQFVPQIQPRVGHLTLFQRTPGWVIPRSDRRIGAFERRIRKLLPGSSRAQRLVQFLIRDGVHYRLIRRNRVVQRVISGIARRHLRRQVSDPELRTKLTPDFEIACKRILISNDWYPALHQPNVDVIASGVREVRGRTVIGTDGSSCEVDTIVLATGFEVLPPPVTERIHGRDARSLGDVWRERVQHYRAVEIAGFPNYFRLAGLGCGLGHGSLIYMIEAQTRYLRDALRTMDERGLASVEVSEQAQEDYMDFLTADVSRTVWALGGCSSWYQDQSGAATSMWPRTMFSYRRLMARFDPDHHVLQTTGSTR
jgi:cation diffusion facilitator CzcD-associated flavoprotein CzcO